MLVPPEEIVPLYGVNGKDRFVVEILKLLSRVYLIPVHPGKRT